MRRPTAPWERQEGSLGCPEEVLARFEASKVALQEGLARNCLCQTVCGGGMGKVIGSQRVSWEVWKGSVACFGLFWRYLGCLGGTLEDGLAPSLGYLAPAWGLAWGRPRALGSAL